MKTYTYEVTERVVSSEGKILREALYPMEDLQEALSFTNTRTFIAIASKGYDLSQKIGFKYYILVHTGDKSSPDYGNTIYYTVDKRKA